jgi:hypothetical protein
MYNITYEYTPDLTRRVYRQLLWRSRGEWVVMSIIFAAMSMLSIWYASNEALAGFILGTCASCWYAWWTDAQLVARGLSRLQGQSLQVIIDGQGCRVSSSEATTYFTWSSVESVYKLRAAIVIVRHVGAGGAILPIETVPTGALSMIEECSQNGGARLR